MFGNDFLCSRSSLEVVIDSRISVAARTTVQVQNQGSIWLYVFWTTYTCHKPIFHVSSSVQINWKSIYFIETETIMHSSSGRKYDSGAFKRKKKQKLEEDAQIQRGDLDN